MYICVCVCVRTYIYIHTYTYINTYKYTHTHTSNWTIIIYIYIYYTYIYMVTYLTEGTRLILIIVIFNNTFRSWRPRTTNDNQTWDLASKHKYHVANRRLPTTYDSSWTTWPKNEDTMILQNAGNYLPVDTESIPQKLKLHQHRCKNVWPYSVKTHHREEQQHSMRKRAEQDGQCTYNVIFRRVCETTVAAEKQ